MPNEPTVIAGLTPGRIVHYVLPADFGVRANEHRPAIIVQVWDHGYGTSNLIVFMDGSNDAQTSDDQPLVRWVTSIVHSDAKWPGTWHFIERA